MDQKQTYPAQTSGRGRRALGLGAAALAVLAVVAGGTVLYGMKASTGKESAAGVDVPVPVADACPASTALAVDLGALAKGEIAALNIHKAPRPLPPIPFKSPDGKDMMLADLKGRTVLVNLWATWCAPCREEMPALDRLQAEAGDGKFEVAAINIDTRRLEKAHDFLDEIGVKSLARYADPSADIFRLLRMSSQVVGLPSTLLVGPDGCEIGMMSGPAHWDSADALALAAAVKESGAATP